MRWILAWMLLAYAVLAMFIFSMTAYAHDSHKPHLLDWLRSLTSKNGAWCCNGEDTDPIDAWRTSGDGYRVSFRGTWYDVPEGAVVLMPNKDGDARLWMNKGFGGVTVRCFLPGTLS